MKSSKHKLNGKTVLILAFIFLISLSGCSIFQKRYEKSETREFRISSAGKTRIVIENVNGNITIKKNSDINSIILNADIKMNVTKKELNDPLKNYEINIDTLSNEVRISSKTTVREKRFFNFGNWDNNSINYTLYLPSELDADVSTVTGKIEASDVTNNVTGSTVNGKINVENTTGILKLETTNGKITAELDSTKGMTLEAVNGSISLTVSSTFSGKFEADWVNGSFKYDDIGFKDVNKEKRSFKARLGDRDSDIKVSTVNGSIKIHNK